MQVPNHYSSHGRGSGRHPGPHMRNNINGSNNQNNASRLAGGHNNQHHFYHEPHHNQQQQQPHGISQAHSPVPVLSGGSAAAVGGVGSGSNQQHGSPPDYSLGVQSVLDQSAEPSDTFQIQDSGDQPAVGSYVGPMVDSYLPTNHGPISHHQTQPPNSHQHGGGGNINGANGNMYQQRHHHHHQDGGHEHNHNHNHHQHLAPRSNQASNNHHHHHQHHHNNPYSSANASHALMSGPSNHMPLPPQGTVMMVYGLQPEHVNCDRLFNLFCLYGNVVRVKFLRTKEGCAMVQMGDVLAVDRCVSSLNKVILFRSEVQISYSKQAFLQDVVQPFILPDGSPSFKDFMGDKNNRFKNPELASKNRILPPSPVLHFFNAPVGIAENELTNMFKQFAGHEPISVKIFAPKTETIKSYSGLVTFKDSAEATEALVICNHVSMPKPGATHPYILRLCFSPPTYTRSAYTYPVAAAQ